MGDLPPDAGTIEARLYSYVNVEFHDLHDDRHLARHGCTGRDFVLNCPASVFPATPLNIVFDFGREAIVDGFQYVAANLSSEADAGAGNGHIQSFEVLGATLDGSWALLAACDDATNGETAVTFDPVRVRWARLRIVAGRLRHNVSLAVETMGFSSVDAEAGEPSGPVAEEEKEGEGELLRLMLDDLRGPEETPSRLTLSDPAEKLHCLADTLLEYGRDHYGREHTPLFVNMLDCASLRVPGTQRLCRSRTSFQEYALGGANLLQDYDLIEMLEGLSEWTGDPKYAAAGAAHLDYFARHCVVEPAGYFAWGPHAAWDVFRDRPLYVRPYHEYPAGVPVWLLERLWEAAPANTERALDALQYHCGLRDRTSFSQHAALDPPAAEPNGTGREGFCYEGSGYCVAWAFLYSKTRNYLYLQRSRRVMDTFWGSRDRDLNLIPQTTGTPQRVFRIDSAFRLAWDLLRVGRLCGDSEMKADYQRRARALVEGGLAQHQHPGEGRIVWRIERPAPATGNAAGAVDFWARSEDDVPGTARATRPLVWTAEAMDRPEFLEFPKAVIERYASIPMPGWNSDATPGTFADVMGLAQDLFVTTGDMKYLRLAEDLAMHALDIFWNNGLMTAVPGGDYYDAASGSPALAAEVMRFVKLKASPSQFVGRGLGDED